MIEQARLDMLVTACWTRRTCRVDDVSRASWRDVARRAKWNLGFSGYAHVFIYYFRLSLSLSLFSAAGVTSSYLVGSTRRSLSSAFVGDLVLSSAKKNRCATCHSYYLNFWDANLATLYNARCARFPGGKDSVAIGGHALRRDNLLKLSIEERMFFRG